MIYKFKIYNSSKKIINSKIYYIMYKTINN